MNALPFDIPDDLRYDALYATSTPAAVVEYRCEQFVMAQGGDPYPCTAPARERAVAGPHTNLGEWVTGYGNITPPIPFTVGESRNVCGIHAVVLKRRGWLLQELPLGRRVSDPPPPERGGAK